MSKVMNKHNQILAGVLVVQLIVIAIIFWPRSTAAGGGEPILADLDQVVRIVVRDNAGAEIILAKSGDRWVLPGADDYPTAESKVSDFLDKLAGFKSDRLVTQTASSHKRLGVASDGFERRITLTWADGSERTFYLGTSPSYSVIHARLDGQDEVYLVSGLSTTDAGTGASSWVDTTYLSIEQDQIVALNLENANGMFQFSKKAEGNWSMVGLAEGETLNEANVTSLVSRIATLRLLEPLGKAEQEGYGMLYPRALVSVESQDADGNRQTIILRVGARDEESGNYVVISSQSPYFVRVASYSVQDLVDKTRDDFLQLPPTPAGGS
jgi:hypothetical protein